MVRAHKSYVLGSEAEDERNFLAGEIDACFRAKSKSQLFRPVVEL